MIRLALALAVLVLAGCATTPSYTYYYGDEPEGTVAGSGDYYAGSAPAYVGGFGAYGYGHGWGGWSGYGYCPYPYVLGACSPYSWGMGYAGWGYPGGLWGYPGYGYGWGGWGYPWVYYKPEPRGPRRDEGMVERERARMAGYTRDGEGRVPGASTWISVPPERGLNRGGAAPAYRERSTISAPPSARGVRRAPMQADDGWINRSIGPSARPIEPMALPRAQPRFQSAPPMRSTPPPVRSAPPPARIDSAPASGGKRGG